MAGRQGVPPSHQGHPAAALRETQSPAGAAPAELAADLHSAHRMPAQRPAEADPHAVHATQPPPPEGDPHAGHAAPPEPVQADPHAGHVEPPPPSGAERHAGHAATPAATPADPHAGHAMPAQPDSGDSHAGHTAPASSSQADPHAGHPMPDRPPAPPVAPPPAEAMSGPEHAADAVFGAEEMRAARDALRVTHGAHRFHKFAVDQLEVALGDGPDGYAWEDAQFWYGGDIDRLWLKSEGEGEFGGGFERGDVQALWSHAIDPWFDLQAGVRMNFGRGPERPHLVVGVQGLAPYWFEIDAAAFLSSSGDVTGRVEAEHDVRLTQRLILQPRVELEWALQDVPELRIGSGLSSAEAGLRLRYQIVPEFAPYVGIAYERSFGDSARFARAAGDDPSRLNLLVGVRVWF
jgi:copper resistance protein B